MIPQLPSSSTCAPPRSDSMSSDTSASQIPPLIPEGPVGCCQRASSSRRHGRFLVQPLMESSRTPSSIRTASPGGKPPLGPNGRLQSSPTPSSLLSERRPSRIIGRFEVCELFTTEESAQAPISTSALERCKSADLIHELTMTGGETCANTPAEHERVNS